MLNNKCRKIRKASEESSKLIYGLNAFVKKTKSYIPDNIEYHDVFMILVGHLNKSRIQFGDERFFWDDEAAKTYAEELFLN